MTARKDEFSEVQATVLTLSCYVSRIGSPTALMLFQRC